MDWDFFESLSKSDANKFLENFLSVESDNINILIESANMDKLSVDFSVESIAPLFQWALNKIATIPKEPDDTLPDWIKHSSSYHENLFDFDGPSEILILRLAYYLGETFVRKYPALSWTIGDKETAEQNMPVVTGFKHGIEMAPILVTENIMGRVVADSDRISDIRLMIDSWKNDVKS